MILDRSSLPNYYHLVLVVGGWLLQKWDNLHLKVRSDCTFNHQPLNIDLGLMNSIISARSLFSSWWNFTNHSSPISLTLSPVNLVPSGFGILGTAAGGHNIILGLHCETAGNRWDGYLSTSATGLPVEDSKLLLESDYYFIVPPPSQGELSWQWQWQRYKYNDSLDTNKSAS